MYEFAVNERERCRSPSWGAWIETCLIILNACTKFVAPPRGERGLKQLVTATRIVAGILAPPRGERGLKLAKGVVEGKSTYRSPSWGAWIETAFRIENGYRIQIAPPRGERGLKPIALSSQDDVFRVAPPRGERGLKRPVRIRRRQF